ncbi:MAG: hypothetical protein PVJ17_16815, partial [Lysobacterales bacterium]
VFKQPLEQRSIDFVIVGYQDLAFCFCHREAPRVWVGYFFGSPVPLAGDSCTHGLRTIGT